MARRHSGITCAVIVISCSFFLAACVTTGSQDELRHDADRAVSSSNTSPNIKGEKKRAKIIPNVITSEPDGYPADRDVSTIPDAVVRYEPRTQAGNRSPYKVAGKTYRVIKNPQDYRKRGKASWYGTKFHGRDTANGERYDMFAMTAASPELPIPSYVRVTNLANSLEVVVRVNDRGPFKAGRIIDLSYAAAKKLGYHNQGTADVEVAYLDNQSDEMKAQALSSGDAKGNPTPQHYDEVFSDFSPGRTWFQIGAYSSLQNADRVMDAIENSIDIGTVLFTSDLNTVSLYKVRVGPIRTKDEGFRIYRKLAGLGYETPKLIFDVLAD